MSRALRRDWSWLATWTWAAPMVLSQAGKRTSPGRRGTRRLIRRQHDYALDPDPSTIGGCIRRGFLEGA